MCRNDRYYLKEDCCPILLEKLSERLRLGKITTIHDHVRQDKQRRNNYDCKDTEYPDPDSDNTIPRRVIGGRNCLNRCINVNDRFGRYAVRSIHSPECTESNALAPNFTRAACNPHLF